MRDLKTQIRQTLGIPTLLTGREFWEHRRCSGAESRTIHEEKQGLYFLNPTLGMWFEALGECLILTLSPREKKKLYGHWIFTVSTLGGYSYFFSPFSVKLQALRPRNLSFPFLILLHRALNSTFGQPPFPPPFVLLDLLAGGETLNSLPHW